jgi:hypothetical protein
MTKQRWFSGDLCVICVKRARAAVIASSGRAYSAGAVRIALKSTTVASTTSLRGRGHCDRSEKVQKSPFLHVASTTSLRGHCEIAMCNAVSSHQPPAFAVTATPCG